MQQHPDADVPNRGRIWTLFFLGAAILVYAIGIHHTTGTSGLKPPAERKAMNLEPLAQLDSNGQWSLAAHHGQVVLINYWATWCGPCQEELPSLLQISREYTPKGLAIIGISLDAGADAPARVRQFAARFRVPYTLALPAPETINTMVFALPTTLLIDRQGRIAKTYQGAVPSDDLTKDISALLAES